MNLSVFMGILHNMECSALQHMWHHHKIYNQLKYQLQFYIVMQYDGWATYSKLLYGRFNISGFILLQHNKNFPTTQKWFQRD